MTRLSVYAEDLWWLGTASRLRINNQYDKGQWGAVWEYCGQCRGAVSSIGDRKRMQGGVGDTAAGIFLSLYSTRHFLSFALAIKPNGNEMYM